MDIDRRIIDELAQAFREIEQQSPAKDRLTDMALFAYLKLRHHLAGHTSPPRAQSVREAKAALQGKQVTR
ncbi:MAG TPA: hypothetical protein VNZ58_05240 [Thermomicrobiales bacterium]|nr:hypothetical protein [Thermomicrobiales bacterium]